MKKYLGSQAGVLTRLLSWLALAALVAATGCAKGDAQDPVESSRVTNVEVYRVAPQTFTEYVDLPAVVAPYRAANLSLVSGGKIARLLADKGDRVRQGALLLQTETEMLRAGLDLARANLEFQEGEFARNEQLFAAGSIPVSAFDAGKLALAQAHSQLEIAQKQYDDASLEAPFSGTLTMRNAEIGDVLGPGTPAFRLIDIDRVKIQVGIPERFIEDFHEGNTVTVVLDALPGKELSGRIGYIAPEASPAVRTFLAEIVVDNRDGAIRAGIMGSARIQRRTFPDALLIPLDALIETQSGRKVFVVVGDSLAAERSITIDGSGDDLIVVSSGIQAGEPVVTKGQHDIVDGDRVRVTGEYRKAAYQEGSTR